MQIKQSTFFWAISFIAMAFAIYLFNDILMPFVFAGIVAYFLSPLADKFESYNLSRTNSTLIALFIFAIGFLAILFILGPVFVHQFSKLAVNLPEYFKQFQTEHSGRIKEFLEQYAPDLEERIKEFSYNFSAQIVQKTGDILQGLITSASAVANFLALLLISPVVAFYLIRDWDVVVKKVDDLIPRHKLVNVRHEFSKIDGIISAYIRGQINVCLIMALFYSVNLSLVGLSYGVAIGILTGLLTFIPYVGMTIGMAAGLLTAYFQFGFSDGLVLTLLVFIFGNVIEGNFITPKLVGDKVQLHPTWVIFALLAGGSLLGFTGVLIAIPVAAVIGVLVRTFISKYKKSAVYLGYPLVSMDEAEEEISDVEAEYMPVYSRQQNEYSKPSAKRKPGRPPKEESSAPQSNSSEAVDASSENEPAPKKKKRRGRPRKVV